MGDVYALLIELYHSQGNMEQVQSNSLHPQCRACKPCSVEIASRLWLQLPYAPFCAALRGDGMGLIDALGCLQAYDMMEKMKSGRVPLGPYVDRVIVEAIYEVIQKQHTLKLNSLLHGPT